MELNNADFPLELDIGEYPDLLDMTETSMLDIGEYPLDKNAHSGE